MNPTEDMEHHSVIEDENSLISAGLFSSIYRVKNKVSYKS